MTRMYADVINKANKLRKVKGLKKNVSGNSCNVNMSLWGFASVLDSIKTAINSDLTFMMTIILKALDSNVN